MAFPANMVWEVRNGGSSSNGGGYTPTGGGTDYSLQTAAQVSYTDLVIDGTDNTKCTSAGNPFTAAHVGNVINITSGTGFTVQRVYVVSVAVGVATCDRALGTTGSTGGNGKLGGAMSAIEDVDSLVVPGNVVYICSDISGTAAGTKTSTRTLTCDGSAGVGYISFIGYLSGGSRTDGDILEASMPIYTSATNSVAILSLNGASRVRFRNLKLTHTAATRGLGVSVITATSTGVRFENCVFDGCLSGVVDTSGAINAATMVGCTVRNSTSHGMNLGNSTNWFLIGCLFDTNAGDGVRWGNSSATLTVFYCASVNNTSSGHGFHASNATSDQSVPMIFIGCVAYNNAGSGFRFASTTGNLRFVTFISNLSYGNGAYGVSCATAGLMDSTANSVVCRNNAFGGNSSGARQNFVTGDGDVSLSGNPFSNAAGGDFSLDSTAGEGAACRQAGFPGYVGVYGGTTKSYPDIGAAQAVVSGGGSVAFPVSGRIVA